MRANVIHVNRLGVIVMRFKSIFTFIKNTGTIEITAIILVVIVSFLSINM